MARRTKVMWLIKGLGAGGAEKLLSTSIPYLDRETYDYEVAYILPEKNDLVSEFTRADMPVFCLNSNRSYDLRVGLRLIKLLKQRKVDLLHIHLPYAGILGRLSSLVAGTSTVVYTEHNVDGMYHPLTRFLNRLTYPLDTSTITVSDEVQRSSLRWKILQPRQIKTIPGGVDVNDIVSRVQEVDCQAVKSSLNIPAGNLVVGNVAHIRPEKGQSYLIEAAALILSECPNTTFVIVGREKEEGALNALAARASQLGIQDRVIFAGFHEDISGFLGIFDVFTLSSLYEGLPIALLEAMAVGTPPVVTAVGGIPEVVENGTDGFLVEPRDATNLSMKIKQLLTNQDLRMRMGKNASLKVKSRFNIQDMVFAIEELYAQSLAARQKPYSEVA